MDKLYYEDLQVGDAWTSQGRTVTEADVVNFAGVTGDYNPIHMDEEFARGTFYGRRIAHGLLGLAISSGQANQTLRTAIIAFLGLEWRFVKPIFLGDTIHVVLRVEGKRTTSKPGRGVVTWGRKILNQHGEVVQEGVTTTMVALRQNLPINAPEAGAPEGEA